ncbi:MAG: RNA methyltransferase [Clostridia bacterium]|nr:RNA methyltransferase [Clostridia bacterium]
MKQITSSENSVVKALRKLEKKKYREEYGLFAVEGLRACSLAANSPYAIDAFYLSESFLAEYQGDNRFWEAFPCYLLTDRIFASVCDTQTPQGILCTAKIVQGADIFKHCRYIYLDNVRDPGNVGTIIRTADALGFDCVLLSEGCADVYSPKVIRSTMGSIFSVQIVADCEISVLEELQKSGCQIVSSALTDASQNLYEANFEERIVFVVGNEANGVSDEILDLSDLTVKIPMVGEAESFNVSIAAALLMGEVARRAYEKQ